MWRLTRGRASTPARLPLTKPQAALETAEELLYIGDVGVGASVVPSD